MTAFQPDYRHLVDAAFNRAAERLPLYEHGFDPGVVECIIDEPVIPLLSGSFEDKVEAQRRICGCAIRLGYDCIPFERCMTALGQKGAGLMGHAPSIIGSLEYAVGSRLNIRSLNLRIWRKVENWFLKWEQHRIRHGA